MKIIFGIWHGDQSSIYVSMASRNEEDRGCNLCSVSTKLHEAARNCDTSYCEWLRVNRADVNGVDQHGTTPVYWSAFRGDIKEESIK